MEAIYKFMLWFSISLVGTFFVLSTIGNPFIKSFIIAMVISLIGTKDD